MTKTVTKKADSLCYSFTVGKSGSGPWWHKVQGQLNEDTFISCDSNNCHAVGRLGNRLDATKTWETQIDTLKDGVDLFKDQGIQMKLENNAMREPFTLQATICCRSEGGEHVKESCDIDLNGRKMLHLDLNTKKWTEVNPGSSWMETMLKENKFLTEFLYKTSQGDCRSWLEEFKSYWEEKLESIALPTAAPDVDQPSSMVRKPNISVLLIILMNFLLFLLQYL
uniref:UL16-binding protein 1-like n=1 Tax=Myodes glareolus TaxID=447135 RepID=UPI002021B4E6|nr:UL16-binding protein 1-like [Myodes glareolus]